MEELTGSTTHSPKVPFVQPNRLREGGRPARMDIHPLTISIAELSKCWVHFERRLEVSLPKVGEQLLSPGHVQSSEGVVDFVQLSASLGEEDLDSRTRRDEQVVAVCLGEQVKYRCRGVAVRDWERLRPTKQHRECQLDRLVGRQEAKFSTYNVSGACDAEYDSLVDQGIRYCDDADDLSLFTSFLSSIGIDGDRVNEVSSPMHSALELFPGNLD